MSEFVSPRAEGVTTVREVGPVGMIMLRVKNDTEASVNNIENVTGCGLPGRRLMSRSGPRALAWMSPDEYLLMLPRDEVDATLATLATALAGHHHLAADVSDARALFCIEGPRAAEVIARLAPVDMGALLPHEVRRTRLAQVAAALWAEEGRVTVVTFRSVARYAFDVLANAAGTGSHRPGA